MQENKEISQDKYSVMTEELEKLNKSEDQSIEDNCKNSLKKLFISRKFAAIDNTILEKSIDQLKNDKQDYFSEMLNLETKRLRFKEEASKCTAHLKHHKALNL